MAVFYKFLFYSDKYITVPRHLKFSRVVHHTHIYTVCMKYSNCKSVFTNMATMRI